MAPSKFQIFVDQSMRQPTGGAPAAGMPQMPQRPGEPIAAGAKAPEEAIRERYKPENLPPNSRFHFDERKLYPPIGGEYSFEELNLFAWRKKQKQLAEKKLWEDLARENERLRQQVEALVNQVQALSTQRPAANRLSIAPLSLQPAQDNDMSLYGAINDMPTGVQDIWRNTILVGQNTDKTVLDPNHLVNDKITVPIDQSQYIRENVPTSTPTHKNPSRRLSRPSMGGSPTLKLSPITETSRDCNSKSSSSSSAMSGTPGTVQKAEPLIQERLVIERPLDYNDPTTYCALLRGLSEPIERRNGFYRVNKPMPRIRDGECFKVGADTYLIGDELSTESKLYTASLLTDDSIDVNAANIKVICFRYDQPANEWLFYVCNELHRRLVRQKAQPDIELSVMMANPAVIYNDGSILLDEYFRYSTLEHFVEACMATGKPFPRSVAAYLTLELIQIVRQVHSCEIVHMDINPKNVLITCCPNREDIEKVEQRTSVVKLIGFDRAMDMRVLEGLETAGPWKYEEDWSGVLNCIHKMFFLEEMKITQERDRWVTGKQFKGFPTNVWGGMFDELLNITDLKASASVIDFAIDELSTWIKANLSYVLKETFTLDSTLEEFAKATNRSIRT